MTKGRFEELKRRIMASDRAPIAQRTGKGYPHAACRKISNTIFWILIMVPGCAIFLRENPGVLSLDQTDGFGYSKGGVS